MLAAVLAYNVHHYRVARVIELERVRTRIATDLHDDIGAGLSRIAVLSEIANHQVRQGDWQVTEPLATIAGASRELVDSMSDIVAPPCKKPSGCVLPSTGIEATTRSLVASSIVMPSLSVYASCFALSKSSSTTAMLSGQARAGRFAGRLAERAVDEIAQRIEDSRSGGEQAISAGTERRHHVEPAAGFGHEQSAGGGVPGCEAGFVERVEPPVGDPREVKRGSTRAPEVPNARKDRWEKPCGRVTFLPEVREARPDERARKVFRIACHDRRPVQGGAFTAPGCEQLVAQGVVHHADERTFRVLTRDAHSPMRDAEQEVRRAIEWIDHPSAPARAVRFSGFFSQDRVVRLLGADPFFDQPFGGAVGIGHHVGRRRLRVDPGARGSEPLAKQRAGRARGGHGKIKEIVAHGRSLEVTPVSDQLG